jgi:hypothetical protein
MAARCRVRGVSASPRASVLRCARAPPTTSIRDLQRLRLADKRELLSKEHFSVDATLIQACANRKSFLPKDGEETRKDDERYSPAARSVQEHRGRRGPIEPSGRHANRSRTSQGCWNRNSCVLPP